uniref:J domain-containing protein n=1 Tax=Alexandrium monilatum TaxID=311494 RepID=A0A7S4RNI5_9DINO
MRFNLYGLLRVHRTAGVSAIRSAYRHAALVTHPDKGGAGADFLATVEAFEILSDPERRAAYDRQLQLRDLDDGLLLPACEGPPPAPAAAATAPAGAATDPAAGPGPRRAVSRHGPRPGRAAAAAKAGGSGPGRQEGPRPDADGRPRGADGEIPSLWDEICGCEGEDAQRKRVGELTLRRLEALLAWRASAGRRGAAARGADGGDPPQAKRRRGRGGAAGAARQAGAAALALHDGAAPEAPIAAGGEAPAPGAAAPARPRGVSQRLRDPRASRRPRGERTMKSRGVHYAHGKSHLDYVASVGWHALYISTLSTKSVAEAVDWHIDLVNLRELAKQRIREGWTFEGAVQATVDETLAARKAEGKSLPVLRFSSFLSCQGKKISLPLADLAGALRQRSEMMALRASGVALAEIVAAKNRLVSAARERRRLRTVQGRAVLKAARSGAYARRPGAAASARALKFVKEQRAILRRHLHIRHLDPGLDAVELHGGPQPEVFVYAELRAPSPPEAGGVGSVPCVGPLRASVAEAAADRDRLLRVQAARGDEAARAEAQRLDLEVMTARFLNAAG